jgi:hypothetical protein
MIVEAGFISAWRQVGAFISGQFLVERKVY